MNRVTPRSGFIRIPSNQTVVTINPAFIEQKARVSARREIIIPECMIPKKPEYLK